MRRSFLYACFFLSCRHRARTATHRAASLLHYFVNIIIALCYVNKQMCIKRRRRRRRRQRARSFTIAPATLRPNNKFSETHAPLPLSTCVQTFARMSKHGACVRAGAFGARVHARARRQLNNKLCEHERSQPADIVIVRTSPRRTDDDDDDDRQFIMDSAAWRLCATQYHRMVTHCRSGHFSRHTTYTHTH